MAWINSATGYANTRSLSVLDGHRHGGLLLPLKNLLVAAGYTVEGTGDGAGNFEFRGTTGGAGTGVGGAYDVWTSDSGVHTGLAGEVSNANVWTVLKSLSGLEILLRGTAQTTTGWDMYGDVGWSHSVGYAAAGISATVPPAAPADEQFVFGGRPFGNGVNLVSFTGNNFIAMRANDAPVNGEYAFYWISTGGGTGAANSYMAFMPLELTPSWEIAPYAWWAHTAANPHVIMWEGKGQAFEGVRNQVSDTVVLGNGFWKNGGDADPVGGAVVVGDAIVVGKQGVADTHLRGIHPFMLTRGSPSDGTPTVWNYPDYTKPDSDGTVWVFAGGNLLFPWDETATPPDPPGQLTATERTVEFFRVADNAAALPTPLYFQRIYDTGLGQYVYYTKIIDPAPLPGETEPNHSGALNAATHSVISEV